MVVFRTLRVVFFAKDLSSPRIICLSERKPYFAHEIYLKCIIRTKNVEFLKPLYLLQNHKTILLQCLQGLKNELLNSSFREDNFNFVHLAAKNKLKIKF